MEKGEIISNQSLHDGYFMIKFYEPEICQKAHAGQFVHVLISGMNENILRRPFSICDVDSQSGELTVVYKIVGKGTKHMAMLPPGAKCNLMGPLGHGFTPPEADCVPILVDGGYGVEPVYARYGAAINVGEPTRPGYTFTGWDKAIPATMPAENMTITAQWSINQYTITFDTDGGIAIDPITVESLRTWKQFQADALAILELKQSKDTPVCCSDKGGFLNPTNYSRWWRAFAEAHGFKGLKLHELRHTQATQLVANGVDMKTVQYRLGHSSATLTMNLYAQALPENDE